MSTPLTARVAELTQTIPENTLLAVRLGDFYEFFGDHARTAAPILGVVLTKRGDLAMCGFPIFAKDQNLQRLLSSGFAIALAERVERGDYQIIERIESAYPKK